MKKVMLSISAVAVLLGFARFSLAQSEMKPVCVVAAASYDKLMADWDMIGRLGGQPDASKKLDGMLQMMTQGKGLAGLDKKRPIGYAALADETAFHAMFFVPVTDLKQLLETAKGLPFLQGNVKPDGDVFVIEAKGKTQYAQQKGNWAFITDRREDLAGAPADPLKLFGDLPAKYCVAARFTPNNIPAQFREMAPMMLQAMQGPSFFNLAKGFFLQSAEKAKQLDNITLGLNVDPSASKAYLDIEVTAQNGTEMAEQFALMKPGKTKFAGFQMPQAAVSANWVRTLSDAEVTQLKSTLDSFHQTMIENLDDQDLSEDDVKAATKVLDDLKEFLVKTIEAKKSDGGLALLLDPKGVTLVAGGAVVDGGKLENVIQQLAEGSKNSPESGKSIKLNTDNHQGVRFHTFTQPTPQDMLKPLVGDELEVIAGVSDDRVYLSAGRDAAKTLKSVIDQSKAGEDKEVPPLQVSVSIGTIAKFISEVAGEEQGKAQVSALAAALDDSAGKDHLLLTANSIDRGVHFRVEIEEGLLKALAATSKQFTPMEGMMPPGGMMPGGVVPPKQ